MGYMIEITEDKFDKAYEHVEKALKSMGKVMQCFTEWDEESEMGHRGGSSYSNRSYSEGGSYGNRGGYGNRDGGYMGHRGSYNNRDWEEEEEMNERRRRDSRGRYM